MTFSRVLAVLFLAVPAPSTRTWTAPCFNGSHASAGLDGVSDAPELAAVVGE